MRDNLFFFYSRRPEVHLGYDHSFLNRSIQTLYKTEIKRERKRYSDKDRMITLKLFFYSRRPEVHLGYERSLRSNSIRSENKTEIKREKEIRRQRQNDNYETIFLF